MAKKTSAGQKKLVSCMFCGGPIEVSFRAMSVFCPHCNKRVVCEDYTIKSYRAVRRIATCGEVIVEKKGHVVAPITATALLIRGLVRGNVTAKRVIVIESTGVVQGDVEAPRLILEDGATINGRCTITQNGQVEPKPTQRKSSSTDTAQEGQEGSVSAPAKPAPPSQGPSETLRRSTTPPPSSPPTNGAKGTNGMSIQTGTVSTSHAAPAHRTPLYNVIYTR